MIIVSYLILSIVLAIVGSSRKIGFFASLLACLFLSPLIGGIIVFASKSKSDLKTQKINKGARLTQMYKDYKEATVDEIQDVTLGEGITPIVLESKHIPNNQKGQYVQLYNVAVNDGKQSKSGKELFYLNCGGTMVTIRTSVLGKVTYYKAVNDFIKVGDVICTIES